MKFPIYILAVFALLSCTREDPDPPVDNPSPAQLTLEFHHEFDGQMFGMQQWYISDAGDSIKLSRLDYLLSNPFLIKANGDTVRAISKNAYAFVKGENGMGRWEFGEILTGDFIGIGFDLGLEDRINKSNPNQWAAGHPLNPVVNGLHWGWADGYVFTALEGRFINSSGNEDLILVHVAFEKNRRAIYLNNSFKVEENSIVQIDYAVDGLFSSPNEYKPERDGGFSHSGDTDGGLSELVSENIAASFSFNSIRPE
ncbi:MAG: hypothetical protein HWD92_01865 [Flavobacteriia bacterium]|nr:hypothetical protein [Flavobacteriia bacterium]